MPAPATADEFLDLIRKSGVVEEVRLDTYVKQLHSHSNVPSDMSKFAGLFVRDGLLTFFQAEQFLLGKWKRFTIGKYKVLERLGSGGMGQVFLCEHKLMRRKVAVKVLPTAKAEDPSSLERFYREARAVAALDHPNIVRAYDIDQDDNLHFLVMEYVDGASLQDVIKKHGPMDVLRACHYMYWSAIGLDHAHEAGLIHRDIKPGNILIDRTGTVKILDMGLARFFNDDDDLLTKKYDENVLGTADYLAPEQALDSHSVDGRADIYSLGATFYFLLNGAQPFVEGTVAQKLIWHQTRNPKSLRETRPEVPEGVVSIVEKMMAKDPNNRYQTPKDLAEALASWVQTPIGPPPDKEMPQLSAAAQSVGGGPSSTATAPRQIPQVPKQSSVSDLKSPAGSGKPIAKTTPTGGGSTKRETKQSKPVLSATVTPPNSTSVSDTEETALRNKPAPIIESLPPDMEPAVWESLGTDTNNTARDNTDKQQAQPKSKPKLKSAVLKKEPETKAAEKSTPKYKTEAKKSNRRLLIGGVAIGVLAGALALYFGVIRGSKDKTHTPNPPDPNRLTVGKSGAQFRTVREAISKAKDGNRIVLTESPWEEALVVGKGEGNGITIEGAEGKEIIWKLPASNKTHPMITLSSPERMTIKNLKFDGEMSGGLQAGAAITITGKVNGLVIEDLTIRNMKDVGILLLDCVGTDASPANIQRVRVLSSSKAPGDSGIAFSAPPKSGTPTRNEFINVQECTLAGPFQGGAIQIDGSMNRVEIKQNRIWNANDGIYFKEMKAGTALRLRIVNNTFHTIRNAGLHFRNPAVLQPIAAQQSLDIEQNYFFAVEFIWKSDDPYNLDGFNLRIQDNAMGGGTKENEARKFNAFPIESNLPVNPDDDRTFLRYERGNPLGAAGPLKKPVGVSPIAN